MDIFEYAVLERTIFVLYTSIIYTIYMSHTNMYVLGTIIATGTALLCSTNRAVLTVYLQGEVTKFLNTLYAIHFIIDQQNQCYLHKRTTIAHTQRCTKHFAIQTQRLDKLSSFRDRNCCHFPTYTRRGQVRHQIGKNNDS